MRPPATTNSRTLNIVGKRALNAKVLMRARVTLASGSGPTADCCTSAHGFINETDSLTQNQEARLILLDEAAAALDSKSERQVQPPILLAMPIRRAGNRARG